MAVQPLQEPLSTFLNFENLRGPAERLKIHVYVSELLHLRSD